MPGSQEAGADRFDCRIDDIWRYAYVKCRKEASMMTVTTKQAERPAARTTGKTAAVHHKKSAEKPTQVLLQGRKGDERLLIIRYTQEGFYLSDVREMLSGSKLYMEHGLLERITGKSVRTVQRLAKEAQPIRLNRQQSTVAFQYAQALEHATEVFGSQSLAEDWLEKPCKYLDGHAPLELIDNSLGFQVVEDYLSRIEHGVYQ